MGEQPAGVPSLSSGIDWPRITVVTPSFNQAQFLEATMLSVLGQGYPNLEYIVMDGGSRDGSVDIIERYANRLAAWASEPDRGHAHAINKGFAQATGEILCWLNSDDMLAPLSLWTVGEIFARFPQAEWLMGLPTVWDAQGRPVQTVVRRRGRLDHLRGRYGIQQESCFWRRGLWERAGGQLDENYRYMVDSELWSRFFLHAELWHVDAVLSGYRWHGENRALTHAEAAQEETRRAFARLETEISARDREVLRKLRDYELTCKKRGPWNAALVHLARRRLRPVVGDFAYRVVTWQRGEWTARTEPYQL